MASCYLHAEETLYGVASNEKPQAQCRIPPGLGLGTIASGKPPRNSEGARGLQTLPRKLLGSKPGDLSTFFPNTSFLLLPESQCLWITSLWRGHGRPEGLGGSLPEAARSPPSQPGLLGWDIQQRNHTSCCCLGEHQSGFPRQQPLEPAVPAADSAGPGQPRLPWAPRRAVPCGF